MVSKEFLVVLKILIFITFKVGPISSNCTCENEKQLLSCLLSDYDVNLQPPSKGLSQLELNWTTLSFSTPELGNDGLVTIHLTVKLGWTDDNLKWNPNSSAGMKRIYFPIDNLWKPQLELLNKGTWGNLIVEDPIASVTYDGSVQWVPRFQLQVHTEIDPTYFPHDNHFFHASFSLDAPVDRIKVVQSDVRVLGAVIWLRHNWLLKRAYYNIELVPMSDSRTGLSQNVVVYIIMLERFSTLQDLLVLGPISLLGLLILSLLWIPHENGQRLIVALILFVSSLFIKNFLHLLLPSGLVKVPIVVSILTYETVLLVIVIIISLVSSACARNSQSKQKMPNFVSKIFLSKFIKKITCSGSSQETLSSCCHVPLSNIAIDSSRHSLQNPVSLHTALIHLNSSLGNFLLKEREYEDIENDWNLLSTIIDRLSFLIFFSLSVIVVMFLSLNK